MVMSEEDATKKATVQVEGNTGNSHRETSRNQNIKEGRGHCEREQRQSLERH